jgi:hypothetical protein
VKTSRLESSESGSGIQGILMLRNTSAKIHDFYGIIETVLVHSLIHSTKIFFILVFSYLEKDFIPFLYIHAGRINFLPSMSQIIIFVLK